MLTLDTSVGALIYLYLSGYYKFLQKFWRSFHEVLANYCAQVNVINSRVRNKQKQRCFTVKHKRVCVQCVLAFKEDFKIISPISWTLVDLKLQSPRDDLSKRDFWTGVAAEVLYSSLQSHGCALESKMVYNSRKIYIFNLSFIYLTTFRISVCFSQYSN